MRNRVALLVLVSATAAAQVPRQIAHEGRLLRADGTPERGIQGLTFAMYTVASGGSAAWSETHFVTLSADGYYAVLLGRQSALPAFDQPHWLGITLQGEAEMAPRASFAAVPFALRAGDAESLGGLSASGYLRSDVFGAWKSWTPSFAGSGTNTFTPGAGSNYQYIVIGRTMHVSMAAFAMVVATANSTDIIFTLPGGKMPAHAGGGLFCQVYNNGYKSMFLGWSESNGTITGDLIPLVNWQNDAGGGSNIRCQFTLEVN